MAGVRDEAALHSVLRRAQGDSEATRSALPAGQGCAGRRRHGEIAMRKRRGTVRLAAAAGVLALAGAAPAQDYPSRPVTLINPNAPGGYVDIVARRLALPMQVLMKQPV